MPVWNFANANLKSLHVYEPGKPIEEVARELGLDPLTIVKLASNENPLGPSPLAVEAMKQAAGKMHIYPDGASFELASAIAKKQGVEYQNLILGNGSNEIIEFLFHGFTQRGRSSVVASRYSFAVYKLMAELFDVEFIEAPDQNFAHDLDAMRAAIRSDTKLVFVTNPNNPTGTRADNEALEKFIVSVPENIVVVLDEAYYEFCENPPPTLDWIRRGHNIVATRTFSKIQGLAGLRIGYGLANHDLISVLQRCRQPFNINAMAQAATLAAVADTEHERRTRELNFAGLARLEQFARERGIASVPSHANFMMLNVSDSRRVFVELQKRGVIVRCMKSYGLPEWIRVTIGTPAEMEKFERALAGVL
ncbi:MAG: histidinol-phosphate transaminase [Verrucomicrobiales bacterium]|jgi:histidinol-phosphate aminotransferase|nr:histidinol-phosphate transaminase [Verrucomicrobiales bacterium]